MMMAKCKLCGEKRNGLIKRSLTGYVCSGCLVERMEQDAKALDLLYDKFIYPTESEYILKNLINKDFNLDDYIENHKEFSEEIMFQVLADIFEGVDDDEIEALILKKGKFKRIVMEFDENRENEK
jgi:hypothetical protein